MYSPLKFNELVLLYRIFGKFTQKISREKDSFEVVIVEDYRNIPEM